MAKELKKMRGARMAQITLRERLKAREESNKALRDKITPIWSLEKDKRTSELNELMLKLVNGRAMTRAYQNALRELKEDIKAYNKAYDLSFKE